MRRVATSAWVGALCWGLLLFGAARPAAADLESDIERVAEQVELLEAKARLIRQEYLQRGQKATSTRRFEERLNDGQALMLLKDYVRASIVFHDLVDNPANRDRAGYADALYNLGESLYFNENYIDARKYYRRVLEESRSRSYRRLALIRLMQIALRIDDYEKVDHFHTLLVDEGGVSPEGEYLWGKTLYARDRLAAAAQAFGRLSPGQAFYHQARYFLGVVAVRQGELERALAIFEALARQSAETAQQAEVVELAHLARGRLLHDLGREAEALDAFQAIEHTSPRFDQALLEICWTYIQRAEQQEDAEERNRWFLEAFRTIEILEVSTPDSTLVPRARLLKGMIMEKMGRFEKAAEEFARVSSTYASVKQELDELVASHEDPVQYFNEVAGRNLESFDLSAYLPSVAVRWMSRQDEMAAALGVMKDLETGHRFISEARALLDKLDTLLADEGDRINLFPVLLEGAKRISEINNAMLIVQRNLSRLEERVVMEHVSADERRAFSSAREKRERLEAKLDQLSTSAQQSADREARVRRRIAGLEQEVYQSTIALKGMKAQLSAMENWIRENAAELTGREEAVRDFREEIRRGWAMVNQLEGELESLRNELSTEKTRAGLDAEAESQEARLRQRYSKALATERELAEQIHDRLGTEGTRRIARIDQLRLRVDKLGRLVAELRRRLDARVAEEAERLEAQAERERRNLEAYAAALAELESESENLAGEVAYRALQEVRQKFYQLVLEADVGVLDVAWSRKMETTEEISELSRQQAAERKRLHEEFKGVLEEVN